jgi:hypothetical protein
LLKHFGISAKQISHHEHNWQQKAPEIVEMARLGHARIIMLACTHQPDTAMYCFNNGLPFEHFSLKHHALAHFLY